MISGRNPLEYEFIGLYEGNLLNEDGEEIKVIVNQDQSYNGVYDKEDLEFTYVYQPPVGDIPPITGIENGIPSYLSYVLVGIMTLLVGSCIKIIKREEENELK